MSSMQLKVTNTPSNSLVPSNHVFVNEADFPSKTTYVRVKDCVFVAIQHEKIPKGCIALNKIQRTSSHVSLDRMVTIDLFHPPKHNFHMKEVTFELDFLNPREVLDPEIDAKQLKEHVLSVYVNQVFKFEQKIVIAFEGSLLIATLSEFDVHDTQSVSEEKETEGSSSTKMTSSDSQFLELPVRGMLLKSTSLLFTKTKQSPIKFINNESIAANSQLFKMRSFESLGIGGLDAELSKIFRRAFASRIFPPDVIKKLGISHVKGLIMYGPPGCGKTLMARQIGKALNCKEPKIINGPEVLNKYVGQSEENIRKLFADAEIEYKEKGDASELHLIIFDELDAICKQRGTTTGGTGVNDSVVNQLLSKIDGVNSLNNILVIGMTNRLDMLDEALLRPGRFEVKMEIGLPDEQGRVQILKIHTDTMRKHNLLAEDIDLAKIASMTKNYSGAELAGLIRSATSFAMNRQVDLDNIAKANKDLSKIKVTWSDFEAALEEVKPAFGVSQDEFENYLSHGLIDYGASFVKLTNTCRSLINQVRTSKTTNLLSLLLEGRKGSGKTTLAVHLAVHSGSPFVKIISPESMVGYGEQQKVNKINKIFQDAYKSPLSIVVLDNIERLIEYVDIGPRFSNVLLQTLLVRISQQPPKGRKLMIVATTGSFDVIRRLELHTPFNVILNVPTLNSTEEISQVFVSTSACEASSETLDKILSLIPKGIGIKDLLLLIEMARSREDIQNDDDEENAKKSSNSLITYDEMYQSLSDCGYFNVE